MVAFFGGDLDHDRSPRSFGSWCIKGTDESTLVKDSSAPFKHHDLSGIGSLITDPDHPKGKHTHM